MGQKVNPIGFRIGYIRKPESNWFATKTSYAEKLREDTAIRAYLDARLIKAGVSKMLIERAGKKVTVTIQTARPGIVIGKSGTEVDKLKEELKKLTQKEVEINILEIKKPDLEAKLVGLQIAQQLRARMPYKRVLNHSIAAVMRAGAQGVKMMVSGRLDGAEMARSEVRKEGVVSLNTLREDVDYAVVEAHTIYGRIGVKVWIARGDLSAKRAQKTSGRADRVAKADKVPARPRTK